VPLRAWTVENFKSISHAELEFAPLTVLVGANSSGKTSLMQSILLFVQAAQGGNQGQAFPLNGPIVSVGAFDEVRFAHASDGSIRIGGRLQVLPEVYRGVPTRVWRSSWTRGPDQTPLLEWWIQLDRSAENEPGSAEIAAVSLDVEPLTTDEEIPNRMSLSAVRKDQIQSQGDVERQRLGSLARRYGPVPGRDEFSLAFTGALSTGEAPPVPISGLHLRAGLPHNVLTIWQLGQAAAETWLESRLVRPPSRLTQTDSRPPGPHRREKQADDTVAAQWADVAAKEIREWDQFRRTDPITLSAYLSRSSTELPVEIRNALRHRSVEIVEAIVRQLHMNQEVLLPPERQTANWLTELVSDVHEFFRQRVVYLGPLRQDPQVVYKTAPLGAAGFIGTKGEYLATVLRAYGARPVLNFGEDGSLDVVTLTTAVNTWAARLEIADEIRTLDLGRLGIQVSVQRGRTHPVDLTSVGVGVSQFLPVLVMCLLDEPCSLIIMEQPELHRYPGLQQKLGDFLLACARSGRQLIVETHSEYLISRLRRSIAEDETGEILSTIAVYFVEQKDDASTYRRVAVNRFGGIDDWPAGFFQQAAEESRRILQAGLDKRLRDRV